MGAKTQIQTDELIQLLPKLLKEFKKSTDFVNSLSEKALKFCCRVKKPAQKHRKAIVK